MAYPRTPPLVAKVQYEGGQTSDALSDNITASGVPALTQLVSVGDYNLLDVQVYDETAAETITLCLSEYSQASPAGSDLIRQTTLSTGNDQARTIDGLSLGFAATAEVYAKEPIRVTVTPRSWFTLSVNENVTGPVYARYSLEVR